ncbi:MAG: heparinase II/III domain-containing protein [Flavobacteriaceae bacterium]
MLKKSFVFLMFGFLFISVFGQSKQITHPFISLNSDEIVEIQKHLGKVPLFDKTLKESQREVDAILEQAIDVPIPKDYSGGYTHQRHKQNYNSIYKASLIYQITQDEKYAAYVKEVLMLYADLYPTLGLHPQTRSYARGKLFWQCLNDANFLVYSVQAYDNVYNYLSKRERKQLEKNLFKPMAIFLSEGNPQFFNRVHNHGTWGNVAVGLAGLVLNDTYLEHIALYGLDTDQNTGVIDNDGGVIREEGQEVGFWANLDQPFSPDGYYTEGPYYQRYAMYPFLAFAKAYTRKYPEKNVFEYKDGVLIKAVDALINLSNSNGDFFAINDSQKGMSLNAPSVVSAVDIAYFFSKPNPELLDIAVGQDQVSLDYMGYEVAKDISLGKAEKFQKKSVVLRDGSKGDQGGIAILRQKETELVFKAPSHGLSHGHYDRLSYALFNKGSEVLQDYGLARFVNIEQKGGGNYLKENKTWAKQTIAHNSVVIDQKSQFESKYKSASASHSNLEYYDFQDSTFQVVSASDNEAYENVEQERNLILISQNDVQYLIDYYVIKNEKESNYDLPFHALGQWIGFNFDVDYNEELIPLGDSNGYQHLWFVGNKKVDSELSQLTFLKDKSFYNLSLFTPSNDEIIFSRIGANDPEFNLRRDPVLIQRREEVKNTEFLSVLEIHGSYSAVSEMSLDSKPRIESMDLQEVYPGYKLINIGLKNGESIELIVVTKEGSDAKQHKIMIEDIHYEWTGKIKRIK